MAYKACAACSCTREKWLSAMTCQACYIVSWFIEGSIPRTHFKKSANELVSGLCDSATCRNVECVGLRVASRIGLRDVTRSSAMTLIEQRDETLAVKIDKDTQRSGRPSTVRTVGAVRVDSDDVVHVKQSVTETQLPDSAIIKRANEIRGSVTSRSIGVWLSRHATNCGAAIPLRMTGGIYLMTYSHMYRLQNTFTELRSRAPQEMRNGIGFMTLRLHEQEDIARIAGANCDALLNQLGVSLQRAAQRNVCASGQQPEFQSERALLRRVKLVYASYECARSTERMNRIRHLTNELNGIVTKHTSARK